MTTQRILGGAILLIFCVSILLNGCKKEYSYEGGILPGNSTGTAKYTLLGQGGECTGFIVHGNYYASVALAAANTVDLQVRVDSIGTYNLLAVSVDGISFSASGTFTATGLQTIVLDGTGTPTTTGNFSFTVEKEAGCSFGIEVGTQLLLGASYTLIGYPGTCINAKVAGTFTAGIPLTPSESVIVSVHVTGAGAYGITTDTLDGISFSASGNFTDTGMVEVTLPGTGTPALPGFTGLTFTGTTSTCTVDVPVQTAPPFATYVLESGFGSPAVCVYTLNGTYLSNVPLTAANSLKMQVYVKVAGNFTIATGSVGGMSFYYTGTFTSTGSQSVTLAGAGTPAASGSYAFTPQIVGPHPIGGEACAFAVQVP